MRRMNDRALAIAEIKTLASKPFVVLDTETTGLDEDAEIVQIAIVDQDGKVLLDTFVKPSRPIDETGAAYKVHGIGNRHLDQGPTFIELIPAIQAAIGGKRVAIYNAEFDTRMIEQSAKAHLTAPGAFNWMGATFIDIMTLYAEYVGDWNEYRGNYRWQRLPAVPGFDAHSALGDCQSTLALIRRIAQEEAIKA